MRRNHGMQSVCGLKQVLDARMATDGQRNETIRGDGYGGGDDSDVKINLGSCTSRYGRCPSSSPAQHRHRCDYYIVIIIIVILL